MSTRALAQAPVPAGMSPGFGAPGTTVTVSGKDLNQSGLLPRIMYQKKYIEPGESRSASVDATSNANGTVTFAAPPNAQPQSFALVLAPRLDAPSAIRPGVPIPGRFDVVEPPAAIGTSISVMVVVPIGTRPMITPGEPFKVTGKNLVPRPGMTATLTVGGLSIPVTSATYNASGRNGGGVDELTVNPPDPPAAVVASAVLTTSGGSITDNSWIYQKLPRVTAFEELSGSVGSTVAGTVSTTGRLTRGRRYQLRGTDLEIALPDGPRRTTVSLAGGATVAGVVDGAASSATLLRFTVPSTLAANRVRVELRPAAGNTTVIDLGMHDVGDPGVAAPSLASIVVAPSPAIMGSTINATISFAGSITPGADVGALVVTTSQTASGAPLQTIQVPITGNPMTVPIPTEIHSGAVSLVAKARVTRATGGTDSVSTTYQLSAVSLLGFTPVSATVPGGTGAIINASFDFQGTTGLSCSSQGQGTINVTFESSDTSVAVGTLPNGTVLPNPGTRCASANPMRFEVITKRQQVARPVTITARLNGVTRSATLTVLPTSIGNLTVNRSTLTSLQSTTGTLTLTGPMTGQFALLSSSDPAVSVPNTIPFSTQTTYAFPITTLPVQSARVVTISAVVNGVTRTATINLQPLQFQTFTLQPATVTAGANSAATIQLNASIDVVFTATVTVNDASVATAPATVNFAAGQSAAVFSVQSIAPQSSARSVTITVTYAVTMPNGSTVTTTAQRTLTVNPQ